LAERTRPTKTGQADKSLPVLASELWELVLNYAKQETLDPLKALGRFVAFGVAGGVCIALGFLMVGLGGLRAIQTETGAHLSGNLAWVPYLAVVVFCLVVAVVFVSRIAKAPRGQTR
jgi:Putative Actinobacterial Holin-X, holin superfamily III